MNSSGPKTFVFTIRVNPRIRRRMRALSERESASRTGPSATPRIRRRMRVVCVPDDLSRVCRGRPLGRLRADCRVSPLPTVAAASPYMEFRTTHSRIHKTAPTTPSFSNSYKRVRNSLKTSTFKSLYFHTHAHSFVGSPVFSTTSQKHTGGIHPKLSDFGIFQLSSLPAARPPRRASDGGRGCPSQDRRNYTRTKNPAPPS